MSKKPSWVKEQRKQPRQTEQPPHDPYAKQRRLITHSGQQESDAAIASRLQPRQLEIANIHAKRLRKEVLDMSPKQFVQAHLRHGNSHHETEHVMHGKSGAIDHVLSGRKGGDSVFRDSETANNCIAEVCMSKADEITRWMQTAKHGETREFVETMYDMDDNPDYIGDCFVSTGRMGQPFANGAELTGFRTNMASVVLRKDDNNEAGWYIETAYPKTWYTDAEMADPRLCQDFNPPDWSKDLHKLYQYKQAGPVQRAYMDLKCSGKEIDPCLKDGRCRLSADGMTMTVSNQPKRDAPITMPLYELSQQDGKYSVKLIRFAGGYQRPETQMPMKDLPGVMGVDPGVTKAANLANRKILACREDIKNASKESTLTSEASKNTQNQCVYGDGPDTEDIERNAAEAANNGEQYTD